MLSAFAASRSPNLLTKAFAVLLMRVVASLAP